MRQKEKMTHWSTETRVLYEVSVDGVSMGHLPDIEHGCRVADRLDRPAVVRQAAHGIGRDGKGTTLYIPVYYNMKSSPRGGVYNE